VNNKKKKRENKIKQASIVEKALAQHLIKQRQEKIAAAVKMNTVKMGAKARTNIKDSI
jgi:hypothetical protein